MDFENTLAPWLGKTMKMIDNHIQDLFFEKNIHLTKIQFIVLKRLRHKNGVPQQELAFLTGRDKTSLTRLINTMQKKNLVARVPSESDKRINNIHLTKKGIELFDETFPIMKSFAKCLQENISEEEIAQVINVIKKVQDNLNTKSVKGCINS
ncbi:MarR family transcriptional regulator [Tenacibaculum pacificus]|uniref:MarR family winged helix-turn-helix transcriptional regulator n=1 Tax=Tenacibaculum pacificus TaxID=3018314 RepID=UPI0022F3ADEC|nr:MarR family transcriptional regulator [Tenacibaculum pacificus]WBX72782.1 MarR family transcriptional regulator [Tenacibaculum pacificus]